MFCGRQGKQDQLILKAPSSFLSYLKPKTQLFVLIIISCCNVCSNYPNPYCIGTVTPKICCKAPLKLLFSVARGNKEGLTVDMCGVGNVILQISKRTLASCCSLAPEACNVVCLKTCALKIHEKISRISMYQRMLRLRRNPSQVDVHCCSCTSAC